MYPLTHARLALRVNLPEGRGALASQGRHVCNLPSASGESYGAARQCVYVLVARFCYLAEILFSEYLSEAESARVTQVPVSGERCYYCSARRHLHMCMPRPARTLAPGKPEGRGAHEPRHTCTQDYHADMSHRVHKVG